MNTAPYLSIVICTYNRDFFIAQVLDSLKNQELQSDSFEIVVVNNNSSDNTAKVLEDYAAANPELPLRIFLETQQGISHARNKGVEEALGEIIAFIDDDETVDKDFVVSVSDFFKKTPDAGITAGPVVPVYEHEEPQWISDFSARVVTGAYYLGENIKRLRPGKYPGTGHACFRKELFNHYGTFNPLLGRKGTSVIGAEDKDFFLRLMKGGVRCYYLPGAKVYHHIPDSKLTDDFFNRITLAVGKSERIRTKELGNKEFYKRVFMEIVKWGATLLLWFLYACAGSFSKGNRLVLFRRNVTAGLLNWKSAQRTV